MYVLTMSVVVKVEKLVAPLHDDAKGIFEECDNNQESANGGQVTVEEQALQVSNCHGRPSREW